jgi:RimJ/RimL family protein N-acetyltransferase
VSVRLDSVYAHADAEDLLYQLLAERTPSQSISHQLMPTLNSHRRFVRSHPYRAWYLILDGEERVGAIYLTKEREIGVFVFEKFQRRGYGREAIRLLMRLWPGRFLANINPINEASIRLFQGLGFNHIQNTYESGGVDWRS